MDKLKGSDVFTTEDAGVRLEHLKISRTVSAHAHEFALVSVVMSGRGLQVTEAGTTELSMGVISVLAPGTWHGYAPQPSLEVANVYISRELLGHELFWLSRLPKIGPLLAPEVQRDASLTFQGTSRFLRVARSSFERFRNSEGSFLSQVSALLELLAAVEPSLSREPIGSRPAQTTESAMASVHRPTVARAISLLHAELERTWRLADLAAEVSLSPSQLVRVFKADTGQSPLSHLQQLRVERLAYLLRTTDLPVATAARLVGWHDGSFAARRFKSSWGIAPGEYRRRYNWT
ncbi:helix-turn-helix domain-containing protein [Microbacterium sp. EST19A]|uniref:AraC family transcriptional regulator n=1 Tax=Microbacterium sp. EST19A TaxID=2862681 RepID=UPI001CBF59FD|nr:helix-turn-helix domain-containing protein [Microbacterium sp. EST19A]